MLFNFFLFLSCYCVLFVLPMKSSRQVILVFWYASFNSDNFPTLRTGPTGLNRTSLRPSEHIYNGWEVGCLIISKRASIRSKGVHFIISNIFRWRQGTRWVANRLKPNEHYRGLEMNFGRKGSFPLMSPCDSCQGCSDASKCGSESVLMRSAFLMMKTHQQIKEVCKN